MTETMAYTVCKQSFGVTYINKKHDIFLLLESPEWKEIRWEKYELIIPNRVVVLINNLVKTLTKMARLQIGSDQLTLVPVTLGKYNWPFAF